MILKHLEEIRNAAQRTRRGPGAARRFTAAFETGCSFDEEVDGAVTLVIEATDLRGRPAEWLDDFWWTDVLQKCANAAVTVEIAPTPGALLHPVLLHHLCMVRRVMPGWRIVGHAYADEMNTADQIEQLVTGPYHEVRFYEGSQSSTSDAARLPGPPIEHLFARIRAAQNLNQSDRPVLVRLPARVPSAAEGS